MPDHQLDRRTVVRSAGLLGLGAAGAAGLAGCGSSDSAGPASQPSTTSSGGGTSVPIADIPVGGGKIVDGVVVTQPTKDTFKAFSSVCTHQGCPVSKIADGKIECTCHGSMFDISTGAPTMGPATQALGAKTATVQGTDVVVS